MECTRLSRHARHNNLAASIKFRSLFVISTSEVATMDTSRLARDAIRDNLCFSSEAARLARGEK